MRELPSLCSFAGRSGVALFVLAGVRAFSRASSLEGARVAFGTCPCAALSQYETFERAACRPSVLCVVVVCHQEGRKIDKQEVRFRGDPNICMTLLR